MADNRLTSLALELQELVWSSYWTNEVLPQLMEAHRVKHAMLEDQPVEHPWSILDAYLVHQFQLYGNYIPHLNEVHLPQGFSKSGLWNSYKATVGEDDAMTKSSFCLLWSARYPSVKIDTTSNTINNY